MKTQTKNRQKSLSYIPNNASILSIAKQSEDHSVMFSLVDTKYKFVVKIWGNEVFLKCVFTTQYNEKTEKTHRTYLLTECVEEIARQTPMNGINVRQKSYRNVICNDADNYAMESIIALNKVIQNFNIEDVKFPKVAFFGLLKNGKHYKTDVKSATHFFIKQNGVIVAKEKKK